MSSKDWVDQIFDAHQARNGGVVRRKLASIETCASMADLRSEVQLRGFHMIISGDQAVIFCNQGELAIAC